VVNADHECYIPKYESPEKENQPEVPFIFYDFECRCDSGEHIPNFCMTQIECIREAVTELCIQCDNKKADNIVMFDFKKEMEVFC
jgi:hypothetical protein